MYIHPWQAQITTLRWAREMCRDTPLCRQWEKFESGLVDPDGEDVCHWSLVTGPARLPTPSAAGEQMTVVSSNDADNGATATGVLTIRIHYLDATGSEQTEDKTLDGTSPRQHYCN